MPGNKEQKPRNCFFYLRPVVHHLSFDLRSLTSDLWSFFLKRSAPQTSCRLKHRPPTSMPFPLLSAPLPQTTSEALLEPTAAAGANLQPVKFPPGRSAANLIGDLRPLTSDLWLLALLSVLLRGKNQIIDVLVLLHSRMARHARSINSGFL